MVANTVDEKRRCARHTRQVGAVNILRNPRGVPPRLQIVRETLHIETKRLRMPEQVARLRLILMPKQQVVHLPELPLRPRGLRRFSRQLCVRVNVSKRQVTPDVPEIADIAQKLPAELVTSIRQNATIDWNLKESVRASIRTRVRRLLAKYDYPPDIEEKAVELVLEQAELFAAEAAA